MWYGILGNAKSKIALDAARSCHVRRTVRFLPEVAGGRRRGTDQRTVPRLRPSLDAA